MTDLNREATDEANRHGIGRRAFMAVTTRRGLGSRCVPHECPFNRARLSDGTPDASGPRQT